MKFIVIASLLAFCAVRSSADEAVNGFVVNGEDADIRDYPYMAKVWNTLLPTCGGAILTQRSVLTAAHCLLFRTSQPIAVTVVVGSSHRNGEGGQRHAALRLISHPDYVNGPHVYDVAIIRTITRITFGELVQPIALSNNGYIGAGVTGVFTGWGASSYGLMPRRTDLLQKMFVRTISNEACREMFSVTDREPLIVDQKLCILSGPRTSVCSGDSGSPLVIDGTVSGVVIWRTMPCGDGLPDVFIRISFVRDWILSNI